MVKLFPCRLIELALRPLLLYLALPLVCAVSAFLLLQGTDHCGDALFVAIIVGSSVFGIALAFGRATSQLSVAGKIVTAALFPIGATILGSIAAANLLGAIDRGKQLRTEADMRSLSIAIETYREEFGALPDDITTESLAPFIRMAPPTDGWGNAWIYRHESNSYTIISPGKCGNPDGLSASTTESRGGPNYARDVVLSDGIFIQAPAPSTDPVNQGS